LKFVTPIINHINSRAAINTGFPLNTEQLNAEKSSLYKKWLNYNPRGLLKNIYVDYQNNTHFAAHLQLQNIALHRAGNIPAIKALDGELYIYPHYGTLSLNSHHLYINEPTLFKHAVNLDHMHGEFLWSRSDDGWHVFLSKLNLTNPDLNIYGKTELSIPDDERDNPTLSLLMGSDHINMAKVKEYLPTPVYRHKKLTHWLSTSFLGGEVTHSTLLIRGKLKDIPFDQKNGVLLSETEFQNVKLEYKSNWLLLENLEGTLLFNGRKVTANVHSGRIF